MEERVYEHLKSVMELGGRCIRKLSCDECPIKPLLKGGCLTYDACSIAGKLLTQESSGVCVTIW